jgi:hypothetical protein
VRAISAGYSTRRVTAQIGASAAARGYGTESGWAELLELLDPMLGTLVGCAE